MIAVACRICARLALGECGAGILWWAALTRGSWLALVEHRSSGTSTRFSRSFVSGFGFFIFNSFRYCLLNETNYRVDFRYVPGGTSKWLCGWSFRTTVVTVSRSGTTATMTVRLISTCGDVWVRFPRIRLGVTVDTVLFISRYRCTRTSDPKFRNGLCRSLVLVRSLFMITFTCRVS